MVAGKQCGAVSPDQVAARIAHMRNDGAVVTQRAGNHGGGHARPARYGGAARFINRQIGFRRQLRQERRVGFAGAGSAKSLDHRIHRDAGSDLAPLMSPHPIRQYEQPALGTRLRRIGGSDVTVRVLVRIPDLSNVAMFAKIDVQHGGLRGTLSWVQGYLADRENPRCMLNHNIS